MMGRLFKNLTWVASLLVVIGMTLVFRPGSENFIGSLESTDSIIATEVPGMITRIEVNPGQQVTKGQVLMELSDINLDILINDTEHALKALRAERRIARGMIDAPSSDNQNPMDIEIERLDRDLKLKLQKKKALSITALQDGIIGSINVLVGQPVASFQPLGTFYSTRPRLVHGFLHDTAILELAVGQQVVIQSASNPLKTSTAQIVGIGQRYTNFPLRLKPSLSQSEVWGQEVDIMMPEEHTFLPSEKVNIVAQAGTYSVLKKGLKVAIGSR